MSNELEMEKGQKFATTDDDDGENSDDTFQDLEEEVEDLRTDQQYSEFVEHIVTGRNIPDGNDSHDPDFSLLSADSRSEEQPTTVSTQKSLPVADDAENSSKITTTDESEVTSSSDGESDCDDDTEDIADAQAQQLSKSGSRKGKGPKGDVSIPRQVLVEAAQRFPPFWRTQHQLRMQLDDYNSDDDKDFETDDKAMKGEQFSSYRDDKARERRENDGSPMSEDSNSDDDSNSSSDSDGTSSGGDAEDESFIQHIVSSTEKTTTDVMQSLDQLKLQTGYTETDFYDVEDEGMSSGDGKTHSSTANNLLAKHKKGLADAIGAFKSDDYHSDEDPTFDPDGGVDHVSTLSEEKSKQTRGATECDYSQDSASSSSSGDDDDDDSSADDEDEDDTDTSELVSTPTVKTRGAKIQLEMLAKKRATESGKQSSENAPSKVYNKENLMSN